MRPTQQQLLYISAMVKALARILARLWKRGSTWSKSTRLKMTSPYTSNEFFHLVGRTHPTDHEANPKTLSKILDSCALSLGKQAVRQNFSSTLQRVIVAYTKPERYKLRFMGN